MSMLVLFCIMFSSTHHGYKIRTGYWIKTWCHLTLIKLFSGTCAEKALHSSRLQTLKLPGWSSHFWVRMPCGPCAPVSSSNHASNISSGFIWWRPCRSKHCIKILGACLFLCAGNVLLFDYIFCPAPAPILGWMCTLFTLFGKNVFWVSVHRMINTEVGLLQSGHYANDFTVQRRSWGLEIKFSNRNELKFVHFP